MDKLTEAGIKHMVAAWYQALDVHAPMVSLLPFLADKALEMRFPEATLHGHAEFERWFQTVIRIFFDEVHTIKKIDVTLAKDGMEAEVKIVVHWEASRWKPPAAKSERLLFDAYQTWVVKPSPATHQPIIVQYIVDKLQPLPGSIPL